LLEITDAWPALAAVAVALTLVAVVGTVIAGAISWRLRADYQIVEAAERFEAVDLTTVVKRYVPSELQSQKAAEEIVIAKRIIGARRPTWTRAAMISGLIMLFAAATASFSIHRYVTTAAAAPVAAKPKLNLDTLKAIEGVWGFKADFLQSCEENPQTISVAADRKRLSLRYAKPYRNGPKMVETVDFNVLSATPDTLVLSKVDPAAPTGSSSVRVYFKFIDANTFVLTSSNDPEGSSGAIARCQSRPK
jgi:hypothetical protein